MDVDIIKTTSLGNRGYIIYDGTNAVAVDVQRDYERWIESAKQAGTQITHVLETHIHNDYITGGYTLAKQTGAQYIIPADTDVTFAATKMSDGEELKAGKLTIKAYHTPGHTPHHMSYQISTPDHTPVICTGGGLLYGTVGRTDLISEDMTKPLAEAQYDSAYKLKGAAANEARILPTHGFGSFCSSSAGTGAQNSTLGQEIRVNIAFTSRDKNSFVDTILTGLEPYPRYYAQMGQTNLKGPRPMKLQATTDIDSTTLKKYLDSKNTWTLDLRSRAKHAQNTIKGVYGFEMSDSFATYVGWLMPWGNDIVLLADSEADLHEAQVQLGRIGMDIFVQQASIIHSSMSASNDKQQLRHELFSSITPDIAKQIQILDVRSASEHTQAHIEGSLNIPFHDIQLRITELSKDTAVWVHCASGYRASIVASILHIHGYTVVLIDDDFKNAPIELLVKNQ